MKVEDEVFQLASELVRRFSHWDTHECNIAFERAEFMNGDDFTYILPETPFYLEKRGLATILSKDVPFVAFDYWDRKKSGDEDLKNTPKIGAKRELYLQNSLRFNTTSVPGFFAISFKIDALKSWLDDELESRIGTTSKVATKVPPGWKWLDEADGIYQFGDLGHFQQGRGAIGKIFHDAMNLFHETPQAISINSLSEVTGLSKKVLRTRLHEINKKLMRFNLRFVSDRRGFYRIETTTNAKPEPFSE